MKKLLLTGVFKPFGVTDDYGEVLNSMELLYNQVTREQGIHSPRFNNLSFGLYLLAENIDIPVTISDFPSWDDFTREVDSGMYSHIGISFIVPNVLKARRMARYIRQRDPGIKIILGGHGTSIPDLHDMVDYDEVCYGEGVSWLRNYFGEDTEKPIIHPVVKTSVNSYLYGAPIIGKAGTILPGVGCQNSCSFCSTSHKFDRKYTSFLETGRDLFDSCYRAEEKLGVDDFGLMDENFCKKSIRARELLAEMEKENKAYTFSAFSSAEAITGMGVDFLVRMGINFVWIGVESSAGLFEKTKGIDLHALIEKLQNSGITVLASLILFLDHHTKENIHNDINWAIGLNSDLLQFMQLGLMPGTQIYREHHARGSLINDYPWKRRHGQDTIWFKHPHFTLPETSEYLTDAFSKKYQSHGPGILSMAKTAVMAFITAKKDIEDRESRGLAWDPDLLRYTKQTGKGPDIYMKLRLEAMRKNALKYRPALKTMMKYAPNDKAVRKARMVIELYKKAFGAASLKERILSQVVKVTAFRENMLIKKYGSIMRQPPFIRTVKERKAGETIEFPVKRDGELTPREMFRSSDSFPAY